MEGASAPADIPVLLLSLRGEANFSRTRTDELDTFY